MNSTQESTQVTPQPIRTGAKNNVLRCPVNNCPFYCRAYVCYEGHLEDRHLCMDCATFFADKDVHQCALAGQRRGHIDVGARLDLSDFYEYSRSHGGSMISYKYKNLLETPDIETTFVKTEKSLKKLLHELYEIHTLSKVEISLGIIMEKEIVHEDGLKGVKEALIYFKSDHYELQSVGSIDGIILQCASDIVEKKTMFVENGSGWYIARVNSLEVKIGEVRLFMNSNVSGYLKMPLKSRQGYVNFKNKDENCFKYCVSAGIFWEEQIKENAKNCVSNKNLANHCTWKKYFERLDFGLVKGKVNLYSDVSLFEERNDIRINVLSHRKGEIVMVRSSKTKSKTVVNLFLIHSNVDGKKRYHFVLIRDLNKFLGHKTRGMAYFCERCFRKFSTEKKFADHVLVCEGEKDQIVEKWPKMGEKLKFRRPELTLPYPYVLYWDFECFSKPVVADQSKERYNSTTINHEFEPASYSLCIIQNWGKKQSIYALEYYDGDNPVKHFFERVFKHAEDILFKIRTTNNFVVPTKDEQKRHEDSTHCEFCHKEFTKSVENEEEEDEKEEEDMVNFCDYDDDEILQGSDRAARDAVDNKTKGRRVIKTFHHCHQSGKYLHALCQGCNLRVKFKHELVCVAHNGSGFDFHLLIRHMEKSIFDPKDVSVISKGTEKFVQMEIPARDRYVPSLNYEYNKGHQFLKGWPGNRKVKIRLIDSFQFLPNSLSSLALALKKEGASPLDLVKQSIPYILSSDTAPTSKIKRRRHNNNNIPENSVSLLFEKLPFPYTYLSSSAVLKDGSPIPSREHFNNDLRNKKCTDLEWETVQRVCSACDITDFRQFTRLYTIIDTVLLAVIWENFRKNGLCMYGLDPTYMCTGSGYSFQCFLYKTGTQLEYIRDKQMLDLITSAVRGGTSFCTRKIQTANNERTPLGYDPGKMRTHLIYNDKVSLYATALLDRYPYSDYKWESADNLKNIDWNTYDGDEERGYFLQVTLGYPPNVQDATVDFPLCPERRVVRFEELSKRQKNTLNKLGPAAKRSFTTQPRFLLHNFDRINYTLHYKALRFYLNMGLELKEIHRGISFTEKHYFRDYIQFNIEKRKLAESESMRQFLKNQNNQIFGKCLQSNKNNLEVKFCTSRAQSRNLLSKPECKDFIPISQDLSIIMMRPKYVTLNKPIWAGASVLDLAKVIFYEGYYLQLKKIFGDRIYNLYTDTDSSLCILEDPDNTYWEDLVANRQYFDVSKIPADHEFFKKFPYPTDLRLSNAGESGKWKVESLDILQVILLKSKQYSILYNNQAEEMKCKGIPQTSLKSFSHEQYKNVVLGDEIVNMKVNYIRSIKHNLYNITVDKIGFHSLDICRIYPDQDDINYSLPLGHYKLGEGM